MLVIAEVLDHKPPANIESAAVALFSITESTEKDL
jgi:hypothetical protein